MRVLLIISYLLMFKSFLMGHHTVAISMLEDEVCINRSDIQVLFDEGGQWNYNDFNLMLDSLILEPYYVFGTERSDGAYWCRFTISGTRLLRDSWLFEIPENRYYKTKVWMNGNPITSDYIGTATQFKSRPIDHKSLAFYIPKNEHVTIDVQVTSPYFVYFNFDLVSEKTFRRSTVFGYTFLGSLYGIFVIIWIFSILLWAWFKEVVYISFAIFSFIGFWNLLYLDGTGFQLLWPSHPQVNAIMQQTIPLLFTASLIFVVITFLDLLKKDYTSVLMLVASFLIVTFYYGINLLKSDYTLQHISYALPFLVLFYAIAKLALKGYRPARFMMIGYILIVSSILLIVIENHVNLIQWDHILRYNIHFSIFIFLVSAAYTQFYKFRVIYESNELQKQKSIDRLKELNLIKDDLNRKISEKVNEQTFELKKKTEIIQKQNEELNLVNDRLKDQAKQIISLNVALYQENIELKDSVDKYAEARILSNQLPFDEFKAHFSNDEKCYVFLEALKWEIEYKCLKCGNQKYSKGKGPLARRCSKCGFNESVTSNTIFHRCHFDISKAFYILYLVNQNDDITSKELSELVQLRLATCWKFAKKVKDKKAVYLRNGKSIESWSQLI